jgi:hypothetical protein
MTPRDTTATTIDQRIGLHGKVAIRLASADVRVLATDGDRVSVGPSAGPALPDHVIIETSEDGLSIRERDTAMLSFGDHRSTVQLELRVPAAAEVAIDIASGRIDIQGLRGDQRYRSVSGAIGLRDVGGALDLNVVSGDVSIQLGAAATLALRSVSGDVTATGAELDSLRIQTTSGDVRIASPLAGQSGNAIETLSGDVDLAVRSGIRVQARTVSGDLTSDLAHRTEGRMGRRTLIVGDGGIELEFRSVSGDLRIHGGENGGSSIAMPPAPTPRADMAATPPPDMAATPPPAPPAPPAGDPNERDRMAILRSLEQGDLDVASALDLLTALDGDSTADAADAADAPEDRRHE